MAGDRIASHRRRMALNAVLSMGGDRMDDDFNWWREKCRLGVWGQLAVTLDRLDKSRELGASTGVFLAARSLQLSGHRGSARGDWIPRNLTSTPFPNPDPHHN